MKIIQNYIDKTLKWLKKHFLSLAGLTVIIVVILEIVSLLYMVDWSGFGSYLNADGKFQKAKTLWDWLQLFIAPFVLAILGIIINTSIRENDIRKAEEQSKEQTLQNYLDRIEKLLLEKQLGHPDAASEVKVVAHVQTLTALRALDTRRKAILVRFLCDAQLVNGGSPAIMLENVDLSEADLTRANLSGADLNAANLSFAHLSGANLVDANLTCTNLRGVDLSHAYLVGANLSDETMSDEAGLATDLVGANLTCTNLSGANLSGANLMQAFLSGAFLSEADLTRANLSGADLSAADLSGANLYSELRGGVRMNKATKLDESTTLPDGTKWTHGTDLTKFGVVMQN